MKKIIFTVALIISCFQEGKDKVKVEAILPDGTKLEVKQQLSLRVGQRIQLSVKYDCEDCIWEWRLEGELLSKEKQALIVICEEGEKLLEISIKMREGGEIFRRDIKIKTSGEAKRTEEIKRVIDSLHSNTFLLGIREEDEKKLSDMLLPLGEYLSSENACDVEASYALYLVKISLFLVGLEKILGGVITGLITTQDVKNLVDGVLQPVLNSLRVIASDPEMLKDFKFHVKKLRVDVLKDNPATEWKEKLKIDFTGEHDETDFWLILSMLEFISGWFNVVFAYNGAMNFMLRLPRRLTELSEEKISTRKMAEKIFIEEIMDNPGFLGLSPDHMDRLQKAQNDFYMGFIHLQRGFEKLFGETDDQSDDIIRYWDCGEDGVCPESCQNPQKGDPEEPYADVNGNGKYDEDPNSDGKKDDREPFIDKNNNGRWDGAWSKLDEGECNFRFDVGELVGTRSMETTGIDEIKYPLTSMIYEAIQNRKMFEIIAENLIGGILDVDKIAGMSQGTLKRLACSFGIPYPEIRLWNLFASPTPLRDMLPEWDATTKSIIIQRDSEPFMDKGFDKKFSWEYDEFHPFMNTDPDMDNFGFREAEDKVDTDMDGKCADEELVEIFNREPKEGNECISNADCEYSDLVCSDGVCVLKDPERTCKKYLGKPVDQDEFGMQDSGPEGNMFFDFIDKNGNGFPDRGDLTEPWDDEYGILNGAKNTLCNKVCGNNKFDTKDVPHHWPTGQVDPANTVSQMSCEGASYKGDEHELIDYIYLLWKDPTFSGVLKFYPEMIKNSEGERLTLNAVFNRMFWKAYELREIIK